jgi:multisubunit Na+/H+ antiporter MnhF subunit
VIAACYVVLGLAAACFLYRLLRGPRLADRVIGVDGLLVVGISAIAIRAMQSESGAFLPVAVVVALVGFVGTAAVARFIEGQSR